MSELKISSGYNILEIWKGSCEPITFNEKDFESLHNCIRNVLHEHKEECSFTRAVDGDFRIVRVGNSFNLHGTKGILECTENDVIRLHRYILPILRPVPRNETELSIKDLSNSDVLLIANKNDKSAAFKIQSALEMDHNLSAIVCDDVKWTNWHEKEPNTLNKKPQISIGGPEYNDTTKYLEDDFTDELLLSYPKYKIKIGQKDIIIYGEDSVEQTKEVTKIFLNSRMLDYYVYCVRQYLEKIAPKEKPPIIKDDPKPVNTETKPNSIQPPIDKNQIYSINEFSKIRAKINKFKQAIPEFDLIFKKPPSKYNTIGFNDRSDLQFSLLLFLVIERTNKKSNWLDLTFTNLKKQSHFVNLINFCNLQDKIENKEGWWDDRYNKRKKGYVLQINKKVRQECHLQEDIIVRHFSLKGVYCLNDKIEAVTVFDL